MRATNARLSLPSVATAVTLIMGCTGTEPGRDASGTTGAVTAGHPLAAAAGLRMLESGGNAMDAAITMAAMLAVARPHMNGVGGDMFLLYYDAATQTVHALNASGRSGRAATLENLRARGLTEMPETGPMSVSVPGAVGGWEAALQRFGTRSWQDVLAPAVERARAGLPVSERLALDIAEQENKLREDSSAAAIFLPGGAPPQAGDTLRMEELAETLARIQSQGAEEFYRGQTAEAIVGYVERAGGLVTAQDFADHAVEWTEPIHRPYDDLEVYAFPPNTQGVALLSELLQLTHFDLPAIGHNTADYFHILASVIQQAVADRDSSVADPVAMRVSVDDLLQSQRLHAIAGAIEPTGSAPGATVTEETQDHPNTVFVSAVDSEGNVVSLIQSLFHAFGSGIVVPGTGVVLHNRGSLFRFDESHPNVFAPQRRPYHTLSPAMVLKDGAPWLTFGTPGGDGQTHTLIQVLNNIRFFGMTPQEAIDAPRLRRLPDGSLAIEDRVPMEVLDALRERGYTVHARTGWTAEFGGAQAIRIMEDGTLRAGADRRREGFAAAY